MCEVATAIAGMSLALGAASAATSYAGQQQQASATNRFQKQRYRSVSDAARASYLFQSNSIYRRMSEETAAAAGQAFSVSTENRRAAGSARASAGARGVGGTSIDELIDGFAIADSLTQKSISTNLDWRQRQLRDSVAGLQADAQGRVTSVAPQPVYGPGLLNLGLQLGTAGLNSAETYYRLKPR